MFEGAITSKIKHTIKHKTSPARLAQLLQPSLAFCFSLQPMTAYCPALKMLMRAAAVVQQLCKSCRTCFKFYCMFYLTCDLSFRHCCSQGAGRHYGHGHSTFCRPASLMECCVYFLSGAGVFYCPSPKCL